MAPQEEAPLAVGDTVEIVGLAETSELNGVVGTLLKTVGKGRWAVKIGDDDKSKVVNAENLQRCAPSAAPVRSGGPASYSIVGTWDDWTPTEMSWNAELRCFESRVVMGDGGCESFKVLRDSDWDQCIYPDRKDATCHDSHTILGPDDGGLDEDWTLGVDPKDDTTEGTCYKIRLFVFPDGRPKQMAWEVMRPEGTLVKPKMPVVAREPLVERSAPVLADDVPARPVSAYQERPGRFSAQARRVQDAEAERQADELLEKERQARERLAQRLEAAAQIMHPAIRNGEDQKDEGQLELLRDQADREMEVQKGKVMENRERYRMSVSENNGTALAKFEQSQAASPGVCAECGASTTNMMGSIVCCEACWAQWDVLRQRGWNPTVVCDGLPAGRRAERLAADGTFSQAVARQYVMRQYAHKFK